MSIETFATKHTIAFRALYDQCDGKLDPRLSTLLAIEKATKKAVTVQMIANWFRRRRA